MINFNDKILFPLSHKENNAYYIITVPFAWINLDFGIEPCFGQNLTQLMKTCIQFIFPIYIWSIAIVNISHYCMRATRLFRNNCIAVLATLFLISYDKILRNVTDVLIYTHVTGSDESDGSEATIWYLDGNVRYGKTA